MGSFSFIQVVCHVLPVLLEFFSRRYADYRFRLTPITVQKHDADKLIFSTLASAVRLMCTINFGNFIVNICLFGCFFAPPFSIFTPQFSSLLK